MAITETPLVVNGKKYFVTATTTDALLDRLKSFRSEPADEIPRSQLEAAEKHCATKIENTKNAAAKVKKAFDEKLEALEAEKQELETTVADLQEKLEAAETKEPAEEKPAKTKK